MRYLKLVGLIVGFSILIGVGYIYYFTQIRKEIPKTQPNVNSMSLGEFDMNEEIIVNKWGESLEVDKGYLVVRESRFDKSNSNNISIGFIRFKCLGDATGAPIFFLSGGPGTAGSSLVNGEYFYIFKRLAQNSDVVILDQRGTGNSIPNLRCRNNLQLPTDITSDIDSAIIAEIKIRCEECVEEFKQMGIDLSAYNSLESAYDIEDLRISMQYDSISLFGYSYGSALAQHYIKHFENRVSKAVFAGPTTPDLGLKLPMNVQQQFSEMNKLVKSDIRLIKYVPDLEKMMISVHNSLEDEPVYLKIPLMDAVGEDDGFLPTTLFKFISIFKPYWKLTITDQHIKMMTAQNIGSPFWIRKFPAYYYELHNGNYLNAGNQLRNFRRQNMPNALFFTESATTSYSQNRWQMASQPLSSNLLSHLSISFGRYPQIGQVIGIEKIHGLNMPVKSNVNVLLVAGTLDGRTPMSNADSLESRFPNSSKITVVNGGHNDLINYKSLPFVETFLANEELKDTTVYINIDFYPPVPYKYSIRDSIEYKRTGEGIKEAVELGFSYFNLYKDQDDYIMDVSNESFNYYGYVLMNKNEIRDALEIFKLNAGLYPNHYNTHNSLAECYLKLGDTEAASKSLIKALELNPLDGYSHALLHQINEMSKH